MSETTLSRYIVRNGMGSFVDEIEASSLDAAIAKAAHIQGTSSRQLVENRWTVMSAYVSTDTKPSLDLSSIPESLRWLKWDKFDDATQIADGERWLVLIDRGHDVAEYVIDSIMWDRVGDNQYNAHTSTDDNWMFTNSDIIAFTRI